jgi:branched-chain amino acid transport system substrate-binding protein
VPVIGTDTGTAGIYSSPMYFPQASSDDAMFEQAIFGLATQALPAGKTRLATLSCSEVPQCDAFERAWARYAPMAGFRHVYRAKSTITQPDYTAECLSASNAGAQVLLIGLDSNSVGRVAASCARQGYRPTFSTTAQIVRDPMKDDPVLAGAGMMASSTIFPYFQSGTPATDEYQRILRTYAKNLPQGVGVALGWVSAKLFEKAAALVSEPPTSEAILRGLWAIKDDNLGGLTPVRLTFVEDQPAARAVCWFGLALSGGEWTSPDGATPHCR